MRATVTERKLAAILSADVVGYSRLMAEDEGETVRRLGAYRTEITNLVGEHRGRLVDFTGDNFLAEFPTALDAVECAIEIQRVLQARNAALPAERKMEFRIGAHMGDVRVEDGRIFGDGVNIAARLEGLARPGGICISATVHEQVRNKLGVDYRDRGDQTVKNIPDQVHVYEVRLEERSSRPASESEPRARRGLPAAVLVIGMVIAVGGLGLWATWPRVLGLLADASGAVPGEQPALPDKPSIVVLPFANMSGDAEQEYFADGITEDLTTDLSRSPSLFVISRNSAFTYKGKNVKVEDIGRELGVRYVLEGSVRRAGDRVRITAQLIDATTGFHVWSERYDRDLEDVFAVQSEISEEILVAVGAQISAAELERLRRKPTQDFSAYEAVSKGWSHFYRFTREDNEEARRWAQRAMELDPEYATAVAMLAGTYSVEYLSAWNLDPGVLDKSRELALRAVELDPGVPSGYIPLAVFYLQRGQPEEGAEYARRAIKVAPNAPDGHAFLGMSMLQQGQRLEALESIRLSIRLDPRYSFMIPATLVLSGREEEAARLWERYRASNPDSVATRLSLVRYYVSVDRVEEARAIAQEILAINPALTAEILARHGVFRPPEDEAPALVAALRRAGLP
jgi:adenylate cyclase